MKLYIWLNQIATFKPSNTHRYVNQHCKPQNVPLKQGQKSANRSCRHGSFRLLPLGQLDRCEVVHTFWIQFEWHIWWLTGLVAMVMCYACWWVRDGDRHKPYMTHLQGGSNPSALCSSGIGVMLNTFLIGVVVAFGKIVGFIKWK